jgi:hypothetical protein
LASKVGEIICTNSTWCDEGDTALCGTAFTNFSFGAGSVSAAVCYEVSVERFCYSLDFDFSASDYECISASINGCECGCEKTKIGCDANETSGILFTCPDDVTSDACDGFGDFFGNKVTTCDGPTIDTPGTAKTDEPGASPPTSSSSIMYLKHGCYASSVVAGMAILASVVV